MDMDNKIFHVSLILSLFVHWGILGYHSRTKKALENNKASIELIYKDIEVEPKVVESAYKDINSVEEKNQEQEVEILDNKEDFLLSVGHNIRDLSKLMDNVQVDKQNAFPLNPLKEERQITVPVFQSEKMTNPKYLSYNENIREKIRRRAFAYIDHPDFKTGEVYLTFVVSSTGNLKQIGISEGKTFANEYLRKIGRRAIEEAAPFPPFPEDLKFPELTFNVVISFEIK